MNKKDIIKNRLTNLTEDMSGYKLFIDDIKDIILDNIIVKDNIRTEINEESIDILSESIEKNGLLQPIIVSPFTDGKFELVAGHRRYEAVRRLGKKTITCKILKDKFDRKIIQAVENLHREDLNLYDKANTLSYLLWDIFNKKVGMDLNIEDILSELRKIIKNTEMTYDIIDEKKIVDVTGMSVANVIKTIFPLSLDIDHEKYLKNSQIPLYIFNIFSSKHERDFIESCLEGYLSGKLDYERIKKLVEGKKSSEIKKEKRFSYSQKLKNIEKGIDILSTGIENHSVRDMEKVAERLNIIKSKIEVILNNMF